MLPKINYLPHCSKRFFAVSRRILGAEQFAHFWRMVVRLAALEGRRSLSQIARTTGERRTRQAVSPFLEEGLWDGSAILRQTAVEMLRRLGWRPGDTLYAVLDDTQQRKRGKRMDAVQKLFSVAKKNRNFFPQGRSRDKHKLSRYGRNLLRRDGRAVQAGGKRHRLAERVGRLSKAGEVKLVFSRRAGDRAWVVLVTNQRQWSAKTIVTHYQQRGGIEVLFKMAKPHLGLGDYQVLGYRAIENYLRLVLFAYLLLTHQALRAPDVQAALKSRHSVLRLASIPRLQHELRRELWDDVIQRMHAHPKQRSLARKIKGFMQHCAS
jgi:hypothetical protein